MRLILGLFCLLLLCPPAIADLILQDTTRPITLGKGLEYLLGENNASAEKIAQKPANDWQVSQQTTITLGRQGQGVWLRLKVRNDSASAQGWQLIIQWPMLDEVSLQQYQPATQQWTSIQRAGDHVPPSEQQQAHRHLVFNLDLPVGQTSDLYLHVRASESLVLPMRLAHQDHSGGHDQMINGLIFMFFGAMLVMLLYNSSLTLFTRDPSYFWYVLYLLATIGYQLAVSGLGHQYFWGEWQWFSPKAYAFFAGANFLLALIFGRYFLHLSRYGGWLLKLNTSLMIYWLILIVGVLVFPTIVYWMLPTLMPIVTCLAAFVTVIYLWYLGNISAKLFTIAWSVLTIATIVHLMAIGGVFELNIFTLTSQMLGVFLEFVLLSIALAERINRERRERITAQHNLLLSSSKLAQEREEKLTAQQRLLELQQAANAELEARVILRTQDLEKAKQALEKANIELALLSNTDPLTKLYNRRHFDAVISEEIARSQRTQMPLSILMIDIDHFKSVNDNYGHPFGDECLRQVATVLRENAQRAGDIAARFGGEEFILALPAVDTEQAKIVAERIRSKTEALVLMHGQQPVKVTLSIGIASAIFSRDMSIEPLISAADHALYQAKNNGRNQVVVNA